LLADIEPFCELFLIPTMIPSKPADITSQRIRNARGAERETFLKLGSRHFLPSIVIEKLRNPYVQRDGEQFKRGEGWICGFDFDRAYKSLADSSFGG
jgi:hypothetical protein